MSDRSASWVTVTTIAANVAVIAGVPLFFLSLLLSQSRDQAAVSLATFEAYQTGGGEEARQRIVGALWGYPEVFVAERLPQDDYLDFLRILAEQDRSIVFDLSTLDHWMRIAWECQEAGGCDPQVNDRLFGAVAQGVHCIFQPIYAEWSERFAIEDLGSHLELHSVADAC